ncbi:MAG TPA: YqaJ viral recombinase family protein [Aquabacterium sp.]|nr:YqaJ viral recombinase family protein [Aquabacterium sp.]
MSTIVNLVQGSEQWLAHRRSHRNASESAAVLGISPWMTPYQLWLHKTGRAVTEVNAAMRRGTALEPAARAAYEERTGHVMQPLVLQDGLYGASLDGMTLGGDLIMEIKVPYQGKASSLWRDAQGGQVPAHYAAQIQHQLMVSGARVAHFWVFDGAEGLLIEVHRDQDEIEAIRQAWDGFQIFLSEDRPPPLSDADTVQREDDAWAQAAGAFARAKQAAQAADEALEAAKQALVVLAKHPREQGAGVTVTRFWKTGSVDYKKVPALDGLDLSAYRGKAREEVRITTTT